MKKLAVVIAVMVVLAVVSEAQAWKPEAGKDYYLFIADSGQALWDGYLWSTDTAVNDYEINLKEQTFKIKWWWGAKTTVYMKNATIWIDEIVECCEMPAKLKELHEQRKKGLVK